MAKDLAERPGDAIGDLGSPAIAVSGLSKMFALPHQRTTTLKERMLHPFTPQLFEQLQALDDVSFEVGRGEFFGVVGRNGSGKSTLLRCLAGIYQPDGGDIAVQGRLATFIDLGIGFNSELPARDNVITNAVIFGPRRAFAASLALFSLAYALLVGLALSRVLPRPVATVAGLYPFQLHWSLKALREGLSYKSVCRLQIRYRLLFAVIGLAMAAALYGAALR